MRISDWSSDVCSSDLLRDQVQIALTIGGPEIVQQRATLVDEHQQAAARMVVLRVGLEMLGEVADALGEDRHRHLGRTGVALGAAMFLDERVLALLRDRHSLRSDERREGKEWGSKWRSRWSTYH